MVRPPIAPTQPQQHDEASELSSITHEYRVLQTQPEQRHSSSFEETFDDEMTPEKKPPLPTEVLLPLERISVLGISRNDYHDNNSNNAHDDEDATVMNVAALMMRPLPCSFCRTLLPPWLRRAPPWLQLAVLACFGMFMLSAVFIFASVASWRLRGSDQEGSNAVEWRGVGLPPAPSAVPTQQSMAAATAAPSVAPTREPSDRPSAVPSMQPSQQPTTIPTLTPSGTPSGEPSLTPSTGPSRKPTSTPTSTPSFMPSSSNSTGNATDLDLSYNTVSNNATLAPLSNNATLVPKTVNVTQSNRPTMTPSASTAPSVVLSTRRPSSAPSAAPSFWPSGQRSSRSMMSGMGRMMGTTSSSSLLGWQQQAPPTNFPTFAQGGTQRRGRG